METSACVLKDLLRFQKNEITESVVYSRLADILRVWFIRV